MGKSYVASALVQKACRDGYSVFYTRATGLFRDLNLARADGSLRQFLKRLNRIDVLVIDDWAMAPMAEIGTAGLLGDRRRSLPDSMVLTSQLPVSRWHEQIGDPTLADGILDRMVHNAHRIEMRGESMRKQRAERKVINGRAKSCGKDGQKPLGNQKPISTFRTAPTTTIFPLDDADHFSQNPPASVASLRGLIGSIPEW